MVCEARSSGLMDQGSATESFRSSAAVFSVWTGELDCHDAPLLAGEILMNGNCIDVGWMAWIRTRGGSGSLPYSAQSDLPYGPDTDAIRLGSRFPFGDTARPG